MERHGPESREPRAPSVWQRRLLLVLAVATVALVGVWTTGALDGVLYHVRLNAHDCFTGPDGGTECGSAAATECKKETEFEAKYHHPYEIAEETCYSGILGR